MDRFAALRDDQVTCGALEELLPAARQGRVAELFAPVGRSIWGTYDTHTETVRTHKRQEPGDIDLVNLAVKQTLLGGGKTWLIEPDMLATTGGAATVAAIFRWPQTVQPAGAALSMQE